MRKLQDVIKQVLRIKENTVQPKTFEGESFRKFRDFVAIHKSFFCEILGRDISGVAQASNLRKFSPLKVSCSMVMTDSDMVVTTGVPGAVYSCVKI